MLKLVLDSDMRVETLSSQVYAAIRRAMRDGSLLPDHHYSEAHLAQVLRVSRTPVREALIVLGREGAVEKLPQRGFRLRVPSVTEIDEGFALRALINGYVIERFITDGPRDALDKLAASLRSQEANLVASADGSVDEELHLGLAEEFHLGMARAVGLEGCARVLLMLRASVWLPGAGVLDRARLHESIAEHNEIIGLMMERDVDGAVAASNRHFRHGVRAAHERWDLVNAEASG